MRRNKCIKHGICTSSMCHRSWPLRIKHNMCSSGKRQSYNDNGINKGLQSLHMVCAHRLDDIISCLHASANITWYRPRPTIISCGVCTFTGIISFGLLESANLRRHHPWHLRIKHCVCASIGDNDRVLHALSNGGWHHSWHARIECFICLYWIMMYVNVRHHRLTHAHIIYCMCTFARWYRTWRARIEHRFFLCGKRRL